jgi:DNA-binding transcriptional ArsR family regulator
VTAQTASSHLARLTSAGLLRVEKQGRHRYHCLAYSGVAQMIESIMRVASHLEIQRPPPATGPRDQALRAARTCYDHLAGRLGVALMDALIRRECVELSHDAGLLTDRGVALFGVMGLDVASVTASRGRTARVPRVLLRPCLDWSERRPHLAGALGAALCAHSFEQGWIRRLEDSRAVTVTPAGWRAFGDALGIRPPA